MDGAASFSLCRLTTLSISICLPIDLGTGCAPDAFQPALSPASCDPLMKDLTDVPGLIYYPDDRPGISRRRCGAGFAYFSAQGAHIKDRAERARIAAIAVPPAYDKVWITPFDDGHLQATGADARGRKQYIYHPDWAAHRAAVKFDQLGEFGRHLPRLRAFISRNLKAGAGSVELALGVVLALIDRASIRVGNPAYARDNKSYGATTLLCRHVRIEQNRMRLSFPSKGGIRVRRTLTGPALQKALSQIHDLPGAALAGWIGEDGAPRQLRSEEVNAAIASICGAGVTAKTFRTWNGTHAAFLRALKPGPVTIADMAEAAAERLDNTPAIARNSYIHQDVVALAGIEAEDRTRRLNKLRAPDLDGLRAGEARLIAFLEVPGIV